MGRTGRRMPDRVPGKNPLLGERKQVRESVPLTCLATSPCLSGPGRPDLRNPGTVPGSAPIKAENPVIVPNQGKSRQTLEMNKRIKRATGFTLWTAQTCLRFGTGRHVSQSPNGIPPSPPHLRNPETVPAPPPIKAKTPTIKAHRTSSRQTIKNESALHGRPHQPTTRRCRHWMLGVRGWMLDVSHFSQSRQKPQQSCLIKANQGKR